MKITIDTTATIPAEAPRVGNVYAVRGGRGSRFKHMMVLIAITEPPDPKWDCRGQMCLMLVVDKEGQPVGVNQYALHYVDDLSPIAFVDGLENLDLVMRSI